MEAHAVHAQLLGLALDRTEVGRADEQQVEVERPAGRVVVCRIAQGRVSALGRRSSRSDGSELTRLEDRVLGEDGAVPPADDARLGLEQVARRADQGPRRVERSSHGAGGGG